MRLPWDIEEVWPSFKELLQASGVIFVQDAVEAINLQQQEVKLTSGSSYNYSNLVLGLGSVTSYLGIADAKEYALTLAIALGHNLEPVTVNLRVTMMELGIEDSVANIFSRVEVKGRAGHLIPIVGNDRKNQQS